jgi:autotransporter-associated beta strand protein
VFTAPTTVGGTGNADFQLRAITFAAQLTINYPQASTVTGFVTVIGSTGGAGGVTLAAGNLLIGNVNATLGTGTVVVNGGTIASTGGGTLPNDFTLNAPLVFQGNTSAGATLTLAGTLSGPGGVLATDGLGGGALVLQGANTYTGPTALAPAPVTGMPIGGGVGTLTLSGANGSAVSSSAYQVTGGLLNLDNSSGNNNNRLNTAAPVTLTSGAFALIGGSGTSTAQAAGPVTGAGYSRIAVDASRTGNTGTTLTLASLARSGRGTFLFQGNSTALGSPLAANVPNIVFASPPTADLVGGGGAAGTTIVSVLPYAVGWPHTTSVNDTATVGLVTYGANGVRLLAAGEYNTAPAAGTDTDDNINPAAAFTLTGVTRVNSLTASGVQINGTGTLVIKSGVYLHRNNPGSVAAVAGTPTFDFNGQEAQLFTPADLKMTGTLTDMAGLTKSGVGSLILSSGANVLNGPLTINAGTVGFPSPAALGNPTAVVINSTSSGNGAGPLAWAGLRYTAAANSPATLALPITIASGLASVQIDSPNTNAAPQLTLSGVISGPGGFLIGPYGGIENSDVALTNPNNTFAGPIRVTLGRLWVSSDAALGTGRQIALQGGGLFLTADWATSRALTSQVGGGTIDTNGFNATVNGPVGYYANSTLTKAGAGRLTLTQPGYLFGGANATFVVSAGELRVSNTAGSALAAVPVTVSSGATLSGAGGLAGNVTVSGGGTLAPGNGAVGTLTLSSNLTLANTATLSARVAGAGVSDVSAAGASRAAVAGTLGRSTATDVITIQLVNDGTFAFDPAQTYTRRVATYGSLSNLSMRDYTNPYVAADNVFTLSTSGFAAPAWFGVAVVNGNVDVMFGTTQAPVPEPGAVLGLAAIGLTAAGLLRRRVRPVGIEPTTRRLNVSSGLSASTHHQLFPENRVSAGCQHPPVSAGLATVRLQLNVVLPANDVCAF